MSIRVVLCVLAVGGALLAGCASNPTNPSPTVIELAKPLQVTCPGAPAAESVSGGAIPVTYPAPTAAGGVAPVTTTCLPASGSTFSVGSTPVNCTAQDTKLHAASCAFNVTVTRPGTLTSTKFLAFGDSITAGALTTCAVSATTGVEASRDFFLRDLASIRAAVSSPTSYPSLLQGLLTGRYTTQSPVVTNSGLAGERITDNAFGTNDVTIARLDAEMAARAPQIVLLMEGTNDLNGNNLHPEVMVPAVTKALRDLAREARARGASQVLIATITPQQAGACRGYAPNAIAPANDAIRSMAATDHHVLVDVFGAFGGVAGPYIGVDGLHPNEAGYQKIAQTYFETIRSTLEVPR